jgi:DNA ligase-4
MLEFGALRETVEEEQKNKKFQVEDARKKRATRKKKRSLVIQGQDDSNTSITPFAAAPTKVFKEMTFNIMTDSLKPLKKSKAEIEAFVISNGGKVVASDAGEGTICIADRKLVKVASMMKRGQKSILRPRWLWDQVAQSERDFSSGHAQPGDDVLRLPVEMERHAFFAKENDELEWSGNLDEFGDSYSRDLETAELEALLASMPDNAGKSSAGRKLLDEMVGDGHEKAGRGFMFDGLTAYFDGGQIEASQRFFEFAGGNVSDSLEDSHVTHVVVAEESQRIDKLRAMCARRHKMPRMVTTEWIDACWKEGDRMDEEDYAP